MIYPRLYIGPMSKNIVDATIEYSNDTATSIGFCVSRRQVEYNGGYVNNWTTETFSKYVRSKAKYGVLVRDHGGPWQGAEKDDGITSFRHDVNCFDIIHIDPWKLFIDIKKEV